MTDLTAKEQEHVRTALRFLRTRCGSASLSKALRFKEISISNVLRGRTATASMAIRVARLATVSVDDLLAGKYPPAGTCPHCGHQKTEAAEATR